MKNEKVTPRQAKRGDSVIVHYTAALSDGTVFDSTLSRAPLQFTLGQGEVISGLEHAVLGMSPGDCKTLEIPASQAYGPYLPEAVTEMARGDLPEDLEPEVGRQLQGQHPDGRKLLATIVNVSEDRVTLDGNHPLAGEDLVLDVLLVSILSD